MVSLTARVLSKCITLSTQLGDSVELKGDILSQLPSGHKTLKMQWLRDNIKKPFEMAIIKAFPKNAIMAKSYVINKWSRVLAFIFPENALALMKKRKNESKRQKSNRQRCPSTMNSSTIQFIFFKNIFTQYEESKNI